MVLIQFLNMAYHNFGKKYLYNDVSEFLYNEGKCLDLLYHHLDLGYDTAIETFNLNKIHRTQHIWITFLLGLGIAKHYNLFGKINVFNSLPGEYLWMLTSIIHDYGYLKKGVTIKQELEHIDKYDLLTDVYKSNQLKITENYSTHYPQFLTYSYNTIRKYYNYVKNEHLTESCFEQIDHGIYGACESYNKYCDFYINVEYPRYCISTHDEFAEYRSLGNQNCSINKNSLIVKLAKTEPLLYKTACLITAQHNIFRSTNIESDVKYNKFGLTELLSESPIMVTQDNILLFLLSLVDTLECTKRFRELSLKKSGEFRLSIEDVLFNVSIELMDDGIIIDYSDLFDVIKKKCFLIDKRRRTLKMYRELIKHINSVVEMEIWVKCKTERITPYRIRISI